jgi:hypothetical protein
MTTEQIVRDQLDRHTRDVLGAPDLERAVQQGRLKRRRRRAGLALLAAAVVGLGVTGVRVATSDDGSTVVQDAPVADAPAQAPADQDFVPGTDIDKTLAAVIAHQLPSLPAPDDVYPSDSHTAGPLPDADWASAEDWQASYTVGDHRLLVMTALPSEGPFSCPDCDPQSVAGGTLYHQTSQDLKDGNWQYASWLARPDGSVVGAFEYVPGQLDSPPSGDRTFSDAQLDALVQDPGLTFAALGATTS